MNITITLSTMDVQRLVLKEIKEKLGGVPMIESNVKIMVKTKHNYKAEWESGEFNVIYTDISDTPKP